MITKALVVLSGGQDSSTCLFWAIRKWGGSANIAAISFDYGQRHKIEIESAIKIAKLASVEHEVLPIDTFAALGGSSLTDPNIAVESDSDSELPSSFVPGRNVIFLTFAAAWAWQRNIRNIVTGVAQTDYSGYPDCREDTIKSLSATLNLAMAADFLIHTPLMFKTKAETVELARDCGALEALAWSHTCYNGEFPPCDSCPACELRAKGFAEAGVDDPIYKRASSST